MFAFLNPANPEICDFYPKRPWLPPSAHRDKGDLYKTVVIPNKKELNDIKERTKTTVLRHHRFSVWNSQASALNVTQHLSRVTTMATSA